MKYILVIGDGMADNPIQELGGKTPLEAASIPFVDSLASKGEVCSVRTVPLGVAPGSDTANLNIFGCDPTVYYSGRAPLEAASQGVFPPAGAAMYRCNLISVSTGEGPLDDKTLISHSCGSIDGDEADKIITWLYNDPEFNAAARAAGFKIYPANSYRHIASQENADIKGICLYPPHDHLGERAGDLRCCGNENASVLWDLMRLGHRCLSRCEYNIQREKDGLLPANAIWFWAEGTAAALPKFKYTSKGTIVSAVPLFRGIARLIGLKTVLVNGATGLLDTNYAGKVQAALDALESGDDFVTIHIEAPDECSHDGDLPGKLKSIENLDSLVIKPLLTALDGKGVQYRLAFISDHKTLLSNRAHDGDPVPCLFFDSRFDSGAGGCFSETQGMKGRMIDPGTGVMRELFKK